MKDKFLRQEIWGKDNKSDKEKLGCGKTFFWYGGEKRFEYDNHKGLALFLFEKIQALEEEIKNLKEKHGKEM